MFGSSEVKIKKGALGALVVLLGAGSISPEFLAMDVTSHGASRCGRDGVEMC
jgi:hypothetical protein